MILVCPQPTQNHHDYVSHVVLHHTLPPNLQQTGIVPLGSETKCCAPTEQCGTPRFETRRQRISPKKKRLQSTPITTHNPLHCGGGPIQQQLERAPHYSTHNVQTSVAYNNPNQHCTPRNPATCYDSQRLVDKFTTKYVVF